MYFLGCVFFGFLIACVLHRKYLRLFISKSKVVQTDPLQFFVYDKQWSGRVNDVNKADRYSLHLKTSDGKFEHLIQLKTKAEWDAVNLDEMYCEYQVFHLKNRQRVYVLNDKYEDNINPSLKRMTWFFIGTWIFASILLPIIRLRFA